MIVTRPPSAGRLSCHHTSSPAIAGKESIIFPRATSAALIGDFQVPYGAISVMDLNQYHARPAARASAPILVRWEKDGPTRSAPTGAR